ncbi:hypothetical protein K493DRAFT_392517 [Basidiobolus meristosporus CBS 931.73]|uniref:Transmembrane protein 230 n=1 Tax=Basidiobolus meristosporus CBS 931.73 TaxID=1314790 RepID=A0A1Y1WV09_9FUNG|nr:hypothetical protein K493DRAFT_392517 [Basidiobolus meristosporus CBS 931.73]|eukprot:ORX77399.1 hypothetical protein K493DRAFT_392517 [Basidiobolus meristosporus CBS 931.73]
MRLKGHRFYKLGDNREETFIAGQFEAPPPVIPYGAIVQAFLLFLAGALMLIFGALEICGYLDDNQRTGKVLLIVGSLLFIPGVYYSRHAYYSYMGYRGYNFSDIPE